MLPGRAAAISGTSSPGCRALRHRTRKRRTVSGRSARSRCATAAGNAHSERRGGKTALMSETRSRLIRVKVRAGASKELLAPNAKGGFDVSVKEPPSGNRANSRVKELIARHLRVPVTAVRVVSGLRSLGTIVNIIELDL